MLAGRSKLYGLVFITGLVFFILFDYSFEASPSAAAESWQREWDRTKAAAAKEGMVVVLATELKPDMLKTAFKKEFGINLEFIVGRSNELAARVATERRAGLYTADVAHMGITSLTSLIKPLDITQPFSELLFFPEVTNPQNWLGGVLPWRDREKTIFNFATSAGPSVLVNTTLVKDGEITSFLDLLKPRWKGKMVFGDPTMSGAPTNVLALLIKTYGRERGLQIIKQFAAQEPFMTRDYRLMLEWVARGKYPVAVGASQSLYSGFKKAGAPLAYLVFKEPRFSATGPGCLSVFTKMPHPNAAKLYINWLLSKNASTIWKGMTGYPSRRLDVSKEGIDPAFIPRGDEIDLEEELRQEIKKISVDVFQGLKPSKKPL